MQNNVFSGTGTVCTQASAVSKRNYLSLSPAFVDRATYDLHPVTGSPMIDAGSAPGTSAAGFSLTPTLQYKHFPSTETRPVSGAAIDIGAYEATTTTNTTTTTSPGKGKGGPKK